ncbi:hypothetical protein [Deinococcus yunweiensis]|uniref:hypothetical protein n=1 Tax=Deinococcus yunweiensis TaxID=367282 RepID=UPI00398F21C7
MSHPNREIILRVVTCSPALAVRVIHPTHLPLWIVIDTDQTERYLDDLAESVEQTTVKASVTADVHTLY